MNRNKMLLRGALVALTLALAMTSCDTAITNNNSGGGLSLMTLPAASEIEDFQTVGPVSTRQDAIDLFNSFFDGSGLDDLWGKLQPVDNEVFTEAFTKQYGKNRDDYLDTLENKKAFSYSVITNDKEKLKAALSATSATILGSNKFSYSGSKDHGYQGSHEKGDREASSTNTTREITFSSVTLGSFKAAGTVKTEYSSSSNETWADPLTNNYTNSSGNASKGGAALSISDGTVGAKFRFSAASEGSQSRSISSSSSNINSDIDVYDNSDKLIFTLSSDEVNGEDSIMNDWAGKFGR